MADAPVALLLLALLGALAASTAQGQDDGFYEDKRGIAALARNGDLPSGMQGDLKRFHPLTWRRQEEEKRVSHPMSRQTARVDAEKRLAAQWADARDAEEEAERQLLDELLGEALQNLEKRMGVATLARSGSLPGKRNIAAMARDGYLTQHATRPQPDEEGLVEEGDEEAGDADKRNLAALARNFNIPAGGKRNVASRARSMSRYAAVKRNVATLLRSRMAALNKRRPFAYARLSGVRDDDYADDLDELDVQKRNLQSLLKGMRPAGGRPDESKRHLSSVLAGKRRKRSPLHDPLEAADYPAATLSYDDEEYDEPLHEDKRFLAIKPQVMPDEEAPTSPSRPAPQKRNVASLARLGWLPAPLRY